MVVVKNRNRCAQTFANINLLGKCNANCYFCLGKDIPDELAGKNQLSVPYGEWLNFDKFLSLCNENKINNLFLTGQTADGLQYKYLKKLLNYLQYERGFYVGVRTNGYLALQNLEAIWRMRGEIGYSIHTLNPFINKRIMGRYDLPDWDKIIPNSGKNVRVAIVLNRYNVDEFYALCKYISGFKNVQYIQVRRISTDTRRDVLDADVEIYEKFYRDFSSNNKQTGEFFGCQQFELYGKQINFWRTVELTCNSFNYFTDGTISTEYFIVEGYIKNMLKQAS